MDKMPEHMKFWATLITLCTAVAILVLLLDFGIKTAILEESTRLRLKIEEWERGLNTKAVANGTVDDATIDTPIPGPLLVDNPPGMEAGESTNGATPIRQGAQNRRRPQSRRSANPRGISPGNE